MAIAEGLVGRGASIDVVGGRFSGRSAFMSGLQRRLVAAGWKVVQVRGIASLRQHPLAAMHLADIGGATDGRGSSLIASTTDALREATREPRSVLFLDDWDDLDESSWGVAEAVRRTTGLPIVLSRLLGLRARHTPSGLPASTLEPSYVIEMAPLRFEDLEQVVAAHIGSAVEVGTMSRIFAKSGGIIGLAIALVDAAVREGRMVQTPFGWSAVRDLWSPGLRGVVEGHLENLGDDARDALEIIALVGLADVETVRKLISWETLELLEERAMVRLSPSGTRQLVSVVPPLLVEFFRHQPLAARRIRLTELILARLGSDSPVTFVVADLEPPLTDMAERDALFVRLLRERARTRRIVARAEWKENPKPRAAAAYLTALLQSGEGRDEVEEVLAGTDLRAGDAAGRAELVALRAEWRAYAAGDLDGALAELAEASAELKEWSSALDATAMRLEVMLRGVPDDFAARLEVDEVLPAASAVPLREAQLLVLVTLGRFADARRVFESIGEEYTASAASRANQLFGWVLLGEGRAEEALRWAERGFDESHGLLDPDGVLGHGLVLALGHTFSGDYERAQRVLDTLFAVGHISPLLMHTQLALLAIGSVIAYREGNIAIAERFLAELDDLPVNLGPLPGQAAAWPRAQHSAFHGSPRRAASELWTAGERFWASGYRFSSLLLLLTSAEIEVSSEQLELIRERVGQVDGEFLRSMAIFLEARESGDPAELIAASGRLAGAGRPGLALNALTRAEEIALEAEDADAGAAVQAAQSALFERLGSRTIDTTRFLAAAVTLTDREREIAELVGRGFSNPDIATRLVLSVRTVESHLHRILRKSNLANRSELIDYMSNADQ
ncbi:LuxR family transcriptional regulator [Homoserinibacter sp. GY 40078]|uniref:helix-turn-helix transcriptional regulator n=1 Tax=Homoserinibacter sp. GY 40078 TaxID=2603275 RepID=UPI0011C9B353|nr:LuxR family transcriptional regulator [Homoserinibacter sp. GY 40078]TXK18544.1 hypothetical protein FVQ89_00880 [Homoserinibacter sp. GY 40078]